jgi:hypothetical protein
MMTKGKSRGTYKPVDHLAALWNEMSSNSPPTVATDHIHNSALVQNPGLTNPNASIISHQFHSENVPDTNNPLDISNKFERTGSSPQVVPRTTVDINAEDPIPNTNLDHLHQVNGKRNGWTKPSEESVAYINPVRQFESRDMRISREALENEESKRRMDERDRMENLKIQQDQQSYEADLRRWTVEQTRQNAKLRNQALERSRGITRLW